MANMARSLQRQMWDKVALPFYTFAMKKKE
jgi:hypothetical protein